MLMVRKILVEVMGFLGSLFGILGFVIGSLIGLVIGFYLFIYSEPDDVQDPPITPLHELDAAALQDLMPEIPFWVKSPDYERVDWLNKFIHELWPFVEKEICNTIRSIAEPTFSDYIGTFKIQSIDFEKMSIGTIPPIIHGLKVYETNENELVMEPVIKWAGNPNMLVAVALSSRRITIQFVEIQLYAALRITLKPLVPTFPCFSKIVVSLLEKPKVDFGLKLMGGDIMSIPGLYRYIQNSIKREVAKLYLWPQALEIPILDDSAVRIKKPVGILHVNVIRAKKLLKMDLLGLSDPYAKLSLSGERLPAKKTTVKKKTLNPIWNEHFKLAVRDPQSQYLLVDVFDWDKVGAHDKLGNQVFPLKHLSPNETKEVTLDLLKSINISEDKSKKPRGQIVLELTYAPFKDDIDNFSGPLSPYMRKKSGIDTKFGNSSPHGAGLLMVTVYGAQDVEGFRHNNPYVSIILRGEKRKSRIIKRSRDPLWNEEFQFLLDEPPISEKIHIEVISKRTRFGFRSEEPLGHVDANLDDVVYNGRINEKYHLIDSKNGMIHVELRWKTI